MDKELISQQHDSVQSIASIKKEIEQVTKWFNEGERRMRQMYRIEEYDSLDFSEIFNIETLIKAKEHYEELANEANRLHAICDMGKEFTALFAEAKKADAYKSLLDSGNTATAAEKLYRHNGDYISAKEEEIKWTSYLIRMKGLYDHAERRHRSASQNISFLKQELSKNQFIDGSNS